MTIYSQQPGRYYKRSLLGTLACLVLSFPACTVGPNYQPPDTADSIKISSIIYPDVRFEQTDLSHWWDIFNDTHLSSLIERAEQNNLNIKMALARVKEARAILGIEDSGLYPSLDSNGAIAWGKESENINPGATGTSTKYSLSADASWEIDLFGRIRRSIEAASAEYQASWEDHNDVLITIRAEIASNYLSLRSLQAQLKTAEKNIISQKDMLNLTQIRYDNGIATYLDVSQAKRVLASTEADTPVIRQDMMQTITALSVLTGSPSDTLLIQLSTVVPVPMPTADIGVGIPAERIRQRPDVKQAERKLAAQTARIGVATADLYPSFSLFGTLGLASFKADSLFDSASVVYGLTPSLTWNVFDMGRIRQNIKVQDARTEQALYNYELTMLQAIKEVEDALSGYHEQQLRLTALTNSVNASKDTLKMSTILYKDGLTAFQDVLDAQRSVFAQESAHDQATGNVVIQLVNLYKALAGGWTTQAENEQDAQ